MTDSIYPNPNTLIPDLDTAKKFVDAIFRHATPNTFISIRLFDDLREAKEPIDIKTIAYGDPAFMDTVADRMHYAANHPASVVFAPPLCTFLDDTNASGKNVAQGLVISIECDKEPSKARKMLAAVLRKEPTVVVASGGEWLNPETGELEPKLHVHYRIRVPTITPDKHELLKEARALATVLVDGDRTCISLVHPMRWPGSWRRKSTPRLARIVEVNDTEIDLCVALDLLRGAVPPESQRTTHHSAGDGLADDISELEESLSHVPNNNDLDWAAWNRIGMAMWRGSGGASFAAFDAWSQKYSGYDTKATAARWDAYRTSPPDQLGAGTIFLLAKEAAPGWRDRRRQRLDAEQYEHLRKFGSKKAEEPHQDGAQKPDASGLILTRLSDVVPKAVEWIWPARLAKGKLAMYSGNPGLGKSQISVDIAARISTGAYWPGCRDGRAKEGSVLILSAEDAVDDTIRPRLDAANGNPFKVHVIQGTLEDKVRRTFSLQADLLR